MKITLDIPDTTLCAFFDFVYYTDTGTSMASHAIETDEMFDGSEITIEKLVTNHHQLEEGKG